MNRFWPIAEAAQADYETLRGQVLKGNLQPSPLATRFERLGLYGLIERPTAERDWMASLVGARRARWSPHVDSRLEVLADAYGLLLGLSLPASVELEAQL